MAHPDLEILARSELFRGLSIEGLREVHAVGALARFAAGETLLQQGDAAATLYIVIVGRLRATQTTIDGQQVTMRYLGPGDLAGYAAITGGGHHPGTVTAIADSRLFSWTGAAMRGLMERHPAIAINAVTILGARYREMQTRLRELSTEKVDRRIAHAILRLAQQAGRRSPRGIEIAFPVSRQDVAEIAGTTLHTVSRILSGWEERGIVDCGRRRIVICQPDLLQTIAEET